MIVKTIDALPAVVEKEHGDTLQRTLVEHAEQLNPNSLGTVARRAAALLDPDGVLTEAHDHQRRRDVTVTRHVDGSSTVTGRLTPAATEVLLTVLDATAAPQPAEGGVSDPRSAAQRRHDGLLDALLMAIRFGKLPQVGGAAVTLLLSMTIDQANTGTGYATGAHDTHIPASEALQLADQCHITTIVFTTSGGIHDYGYEKRCAPENLRRVLTARDKGCSFPDCTAPPAWTQAHHIRSWNHHGRTKLQNLTLLCGPHHRDHDKLGWSCHMTDGVPMWTPPRWLDPEQKPLRNKAHL